MKPMSQSLPEISADPAFPDGVTRPRSTPLAVAVPRTRLAAWPLSYQQTLALAVATLVLLAACLRLYGLNYGGFSEDEVNKVNAIRAYERGDFSANAEHPMVMKAAMFACWKAAQVWNGLAAPAGWPTMSPEAALRLPNALAGTAAVIPLFLLVRAFFGPMAAFWAALLLAFDVNAAGLNRIGKEDSFLVLFLLLGAWLYEAARQRHLRDGRAPHRWYAASGAAFGLMLASKYMPYYLGLWAIFGVAAGVEARRSTGTRQDAAPTVEQRASKWFYLAIVLAFLAANPAIVLPATWDYLLGYVHGRTITHHGAYFAGQVYMNMVSATPFGLPWYFYFAYLFTKVPLPILLAMGLGVAELVRRRRERGAVFARVFLIFFLLPASLMASKFARYLLPTLVMLDIVAALGVVRALQLLQGEGASRARTLAAATVAAVLVAVPLVALVTSVPYPTLHQNVIGRRLSVPGGMFPNDELYDVGVREAVTWVAQRAAPGAAIASDAPGVVGEYLQRLGRPDIEARSLSMAGVAPPPRQTWLLAQNSHACFESVAMVEQARRQWHPDFVHRVRGTPAVEVFRLPW